MHSFGPQRAIKTLLCVASNPGVLGGLLESRYTLEFARDIEHALQLLGDAGSGTYCLALISGSSIGSGQEALLDELRNRLPMLLLAGESSVRHAGRFDATVYGSPSAEEIALRISEAEDRWSGNARLRLWESVHAASEVARGVAHDFNNLLAMILGNLELLHLYADDPKVRALAGSVIERAESGSRLTARLEVLSCPGGEPDAEDLNTLVRRYVAIAGDCLPDNVRIETSLSPGPIAIHVNKRRFEKTLDLLIDNACDATPGGGVVTLATSKPGEKPASSMARRVADELLYYPASLEVRDSGHGMSDDTVDRAFELFYSTRDRGRSGGVGLSVARACMETDGATLAIASEEGRGTSVFCLFPGIENSNSDR